MNEEAKVIPAGSDGVVFLPYMSGERSPIWDPDAKGVYYGLDFSKKKGHLIRAAMEGTAYALKHNLEAAEEAGAKVEVLKAMGGAANSHLWTQIKSDVTGKTMEVPSSDTATKALKKRWRRPSIKEESIRRMWSIRKSTKRIMRHTELCMNN